MLHSLRFFYCISISPIFFFLIKKISTDKYNRGVKSVFFATNFYKYVFPGHFSPIYSPICVQIFIFLRFFGVTENTKILEKVSRDTFFRKFDKTVPTISYSELVKIPPDGIGVGLYQHDVNSQKLSESFIREFKNKVNWYWISMSQELSEDFIREFQDKVDWSRISIYQKLADSFKEEFKDRLN